MTICIYAGVSNKVGVPEVAPQAIHLPRSGSEVKSKIFWRGEAEGVGLQASPLETDEELTGMPMVEHIKDAPGINIGHPLDPDAPWTWPQDGGEDLIEIGHPVDPDDTSMIQYDASKVISIGEELDPDNYTAWPVGKNQTEFSLGEQLDLDDEQSWLKYEQEEARDIGSPVDPNPP